MSLEAENVLKEKRAGEKSERDRKRREEWEIHREKRRKE